MTGLTQRLRFWGTISWCTGLAVIAFDFLALPVLDVRASVSYLFFSIAAGLAAWGEKREFGTRVSLYRLHDALIYSPWKFLLLYFLWISAFSPFTESPLRSVLYAVNGWCALFLVGLTAQFLFAERGEGGVFLLPERLALAFRFYAATALLLFADTLLHLFFPELPLPILINEQVNLFLFFTIGFPFLLWDFLKDGRRLLPRLLSGPAILLGAVTMILIGRRFYQAALLLTLGSLLSLYVYKRVRLRNAVLLAAGLAIAGFAALLALRGSLGSNTVWLAALEDARFLAAERMTGSFAAAIAILEQTSYLGRGLGLSPERGVWARILAEAGLVGFFLYCAFFVNLLWDLLRVRRSARPVVSNVAVVSLGLFLLLVSHYVENPYGAYVWVWYAIWALLASTPKKRGRVS